MKKATKSDIEQVKADLKKQMGYCFINGIYHYKSVVKETPTSKVKQYCALTEERCPYFKKIRQHEYCTQYSKTR